MHSLHAHRRCLISSPHMLQVRAASRTAGSTLDELASPAAEAACARVVMLGVGVSSSDIVGGAERCREHACRCLPLSPHPLSTESLNHGVRQDRSSPAPHGASGHLHKRLIQVRHLLHASLHRLVARSIAAAEWIGAPLLLGTLATLR
jgi:hypothetical protein